MNDWSARDIQAWEYQPLGPFLAKSFATTVTPWVITPEALAPFCIAQPARPARDPAPLPYLLDEADQREGAYDIELEALLMTPGLRERNLPPTKVALSSTRHMYWTIAQLIAHHSSNGCNLRSGDLFGSGTISAPGPLGGGSLLEATRGGTLSLRFESGEETNSKRDLRDIRQRCSSSHHSDANAEAADQDQAGRPGQVEVKPDQGEELQAKPGVNE